MKISKPNEKLIENINNGEICDLYSLISKKVGEPSLKYNIDLMKEKKFDDYENKKDTIEEYLSKFYGETYDVPSSNFNNPLPNTKKYTDVMIDECREKIHNFEISTGVFFETTAEDGITFDLTSEIVYEFTEDIEKWIKEYIFVCIYLEEGGLIKLIDKEIDKNDVSLFFSTCKNEIEKVHELKFFESQLDDRIIYRKCDLDYSEFKIYFNEEKYNTYKEWLSKKIWIHPNLDVFVNRSFVEQDEYMFNKSNKLTLLAIISSIFLSIISIVFSLNISKTSSNFWEVNEEKEYQQLVNQNKTLQQINEVLIEKDYQISQLENQIKVYTELLSETMENNNLDTNEN